MKIFSLAVVLLAIMSLASPTMAQVQLRCNARDNVLELLAKKYKETPIAMGVTTTGSLIEVLTTIKGDTWTIIVTTPQGISCFVAAGEGWRSMEQSGISKGSAI